LLDRLADDPCLERAEVRGDVGKFRHVLKAGGHEDALIIKIDHAWRSNGQMAVGCTIF